MSTNRTINEPSKQIPVVGDYDVIVCGGGTSGIPAAIAAARKGVRVALLERYGFTGGVPAYCIMPAWHGLTDHHSGLLSEFALRMQQLVKGTDIPDPFELSHMEPEHVKELSLKMLLEAGVEIHLHTMVVDIIKEDNVVKGILTESKSGRRAFMAKVVVDATGDGDVAYQAGASYMKGNADGIMQAMTLRFRVGYVDINKYLEWAEAHSEYYQKYKNQNMEWIKNRARQDKNFFMMGDLTELYKQNNVDGNLPLESYFNVSSIRANELSINGTRIHGGDGTKEEDLTKAEITCRTQAYSLWRFLKANIPGFEDSRIIETAPQIGVRETRCIVGDYILTEADCRGRAKFEDVVMTSKLDFDIHDPTYVLELLEGLVDVPYRCFLPKGVENLLVVGRALSTDHVANSTVRKMEIVFQAGQVGGTAAALATKVGVSPRNLDYKQLQKELKADGLKF